MTSRLSPSPPRPQPHARPPSTPQLENMHITADINANNVPTTLKLIENPGLARATLKLVELLCTGEAPDTYDSAFVGGRGQKGAGGIEGEEKDLWAHRALAVVREHVEKRRTSRGSRGMEEGGGMGEGTGEG
ncbi:hypothetical protein J132_07816 [Termitomyces sp. J132]|nr:hypothetical protein J132_07816 [Termitomyces sp. J132]